MTRTSRNPAEREGPAALRLRQPASTLQGVVRTVAEGLSASRFAAAEPNLFGRFGGERDRGQSGALVRPVAERLRGAAATCTPEISLSGFEIDAVGLLLRRYRCRHAFFPASALDSVTMRGDGSPLCGLYASQAGQNKPGRKANDAAEHRWLFILMLPTTN